jgi:hypothetical protein
MGEWSWSEGTVIERVISTRMGDQDSLFAMKKP